MRRRVLRTVAGGRGRRCLRRDGRHEDGDDERGHRHRPERSPRQRHCCSSSCVVHSPAPEETGRLGATDHQERTGRALSPLAVSSASPPLSKSRLGRRARYNSVGTGTEEPLFE